MKRLQDKYNEMSPKTLDRYKIIGWNNLYRRVHLLENHITELEHYILALQDSLRELRLK